MMRDLALVEAEEAPAKTYRWVQTGTSAGAALSSPSLCCKALPMISLAKRVLLEKNEKPLDFQAQRRSLSHAWILPTPPLAPRRARKRVEGGASSNVFSMFDQSQIQEFKEAFTIMDQNRDGFIDKEDLRDTFAALGRINVKNEELEAMVKEAPGPINFTVFLTMFGEKLKGTDPEETILHAFKVFDTEGKGFVKADLSNRCLQLSHQMCAATSTTGICATSSRTVKRKTRRLESTLHLESVETGGGLLQPEGTGEALPSHRLG
ncbi:myosin regulatory light chain 10 isoform X2 [Heterocephalus glaber]|nr:myosin regulatory light chain 10 isoform X2 [Heterocephalus glaber]XP_021110127.1 myosin regulatory light chain 10 isoform X2 [Heterocephalus glaber]